MPDAMVELCVERSVYKYLCRNHYLILNYTIK